MPPDSPQTAQAKTSQGTAQGHPQGTQGPLKVRKPEARSRVSPMGRSCFLWPMAEAFGRGCSTDFYAALVAHCGGETVISEPRRMLCRRAALYEVELVVLENSMAELRCKGHQPDYEGLDLYNRLGGNQRRTLEAIGLDRKPRDISPNLATYMRGLEAERVG